MGLFRRRRVDKARVTPPPDRSAEPTARPPITADRAPLTGDRSPLAGQRPAVAGERPPLAGVEEALRVAVYSAASVQRAGPGELIVREGEPMKFVCVLVGGVAAVTTTREGRATLIALLQPGDCIGTLGATGPAAYSVTARETCTWIGLSREALNLLSPAEQLAVSQWMAATALIQLDRTLGRQAGLRQELDHLRGWAVERQKAARQRLAAPGVQQAVARIPRLPVYASSILSRLLDDRTHADDVVEAIKSDPALAALVLKTVNSAAYGLPSRVDDYYHAFLHLGTIKVYQLVVSSGLDSVFTTTPDGEALLAHAQLISLLMHEIAQLSGAVRPELAATIGLLHDVGRSVGPLVEARWPELAPGIAGVATPVLGAALLRSWKVADNVVEPIARQQDAEVLPPEEVEAAHRDTVALIYVAHLCHDVITGGAAMAPSPMHAEAYLAALGLREQSPSELCRNRLGGAIARHARHLPARIRTSLRPEFLEA